MTSLYQSLRHRTWIALLAIAAALILTPSFAHAQAFCASGELTNGYIGNSETDIEQTVCIGTDWSYAEVENDSYGTYQDYDTLQVYGVGDEAVITDNNGDTLYDSGMSLDLPDSNGGSSVYIDVPGEIYVAGAGGGDTLSTSIIECQNAPDSQYAVPQCYWDYIDVMQGLSVQYYTQPLPTPTVSLTSSPASSSYGQTVTFTANISVNVDGEYMELVDGNSTLIGNVAISGSTATFTTGTLLPGTHSIFAYYYGDTNYNPSDSNYVTQVVIPSYPAQAAGTIYRYVISAVGAPTGYASNGDLLNYTDSVNGTWSVGYDGLDRLAGGSATSGYYQGLQMSWTYDSFGNRTSETFGGSPGISLPTSTTANYNASNQVTGGSIAYDYPSGDVTSDNSNNYLYDAEGRICAVQDRWFGGMTGYIYDAEGSRVAKGTISSWSCTTFTSGVPNNGFAPTNSYVIGPSGEQLTETDGSGNWKHTNVYAAGRLIATYDADPTSGTQVLHFQFADWLGSRRVQTDYAGNTEETCASLPYGNAQNCVLTSLATADDATEHHFTGKERDAESGLDYFGARYYASTMGRWMSPDWSDKPEAVPYSSLNDPQTLNLYGYVRNNPLWRPDIDGHGYWGDAWKQLRQDVTSAVKTVSVTVEVGVGLKLSTEQNGSEIHGGGSIHGEVTYSSKGEKGVGKAEVDVGAKSGTLIVGGERGIQTTSDKNGTINGVESYKEDEKGVSVGGQDAKATGAEYSVGAAAYEPDGGGGAHVSVGATEANKVVADVKDAAEHAAQQVIQAVKDAGK